MFTSASPQTHTDALSHKQYNRLSTHSACLCPAQCTPSRPDFPRSVNPCQLLPPPLEKNSGKCTKGQNCHFLHSRSSASDGYQRGKAHERTPQIPDRPAKRSKSRAVTATASSTNATGTSLCGCSYSSSRGDDFDSGGGLPTTTGRFIATSGGGIGPCGGSSCEGETPIYNASYEDAEGNTGHSMTAAAAARNTAAARSAVSFRDALIGDLGFCGVSSCT